MLMNGETIPAGTVDIETRPKLCLDLVRRVLSVSTTTMRLLVEIVIIAGLIYLGWDTPFKQRVDQVRSAVHTAGQAVSKKTAAPSPGSIATPEASTPAP